MEFDGTLQAAFRMIGETRIQLEKEGEVRKLEQLEVQLGIVADTVMVSKQRALKSWADKQQPRLTEVE